MKPKHKLGGEMDPELIKVAEFTLYGVFSTIGGSLLLAVLILKMRSAGRWINWKTAKPWFLAPAWNVWIASTMKL